METICPQPASLIHSYSATATNSVSSSSSVVAPPAAAAPSRPNSTTAVTTRVPSIAKPSWASRRRGHPAKAAFAAGIPAERNFELFGVEIGPQDVSEVQLRIRHLPKQKVADSALAAGAD